MCPKESSVESHKKESKQLRGTLAESMAAGMTSFSNSDANLLKFHGIYQGYDRDSATVRKQIGIGKKIEFMVRCIVPGGKLTSNQYLALDELAGLHGNSQLRITARQTIQFHGVLMENLRSTIAEINAAMLTTLGACGDIVRNVVATPAPFASIKHRLLYEEAQHLSAALAPKTHAYHEIWLGKKPITDQPERDALYRDNFLPRKFKIGLTLPEDNSVDILSNDLGLIAVFEGSVLSGYIMTVGGGYGMTHNKASTYARLATPVAFVPKERTLETIKAVICVWHQHGDRTDRKHARIKYLIEEKGIDWLRANMVPYLEAELLPPPPLPPFGVIDHMGWHPQDNDRFYYGLPVVNGRITDTDPHRPEIHLRSALKTIMTTLSPEVVLTPGQDLLLVNLEATDRTRIEKILTSFSVPLPEQVSHIQRWAMACPALPTCGLALTEAERIRVPLIKEIENMLTKHNLNKERLVVRITGCPNGCVRPYTTDIGIIGRTPGCYTIYLGGDSLGSRLGVAIFERVPLDKITAVLEPVMENFARTRKNNERFGDYCHRIGPVAIKSMATTYIHN